MRSTVRPSVAHAARMRDDADVVVAGLFWSLFSVDCLRAMKTPSVPMVIELPCETPMMKEEDKDPSDGLVSFDDDDDDDDDEDDDEEHEHEHIHDNGNAFICCCCCWIEWMTSLIIPRICAL